jgi:hypothetical protein
VGRQSEGQKETIRRVMHEYKHGELERTGSGSKVENPKQAIAIALHEAGATNRESEETNQKNLRRTKGKERRGETAEAEVEGKAAQDRTLQGESGTQESGSGRSKSALYDEAKRRGIAGRSKMSKAELAEALGK